MLEFLKMFVQGIVYFILSPIFAAILLLHIAYVIVITIWMEIKNLILFFMGTNLRAPDIAETKLAEKKAEAAKIGGVK